MRIAVLQHVDFEGPGAIAEWAASRRHDLAAVRLDRGDRLPPPESLDALVVMGGPMGVSDEDRFPWLRAEKQLLATVIAAGGRPVLGVCLGAQLVAEVLGAPVTANPHREIGWLPIRWTPGARGLPAFAHVPSTSVVFHWHGDTFALPAGTIHLASSEACRQQGFCTPDGRVVALQFHLEMRPQDVASLAASGKAELAEGGDHVQPAERLLSEAPERAAALLPLLETCLDAWIESGRR